MAGDQVSPKPANTGYRPLAEWRALWLPAIADPKVCAEARETMAAQRAAGQTKLHWRNEDASRRAKIVTAVSQCDIACVVVIGMPLGKSKQERGRALCMERLLYELDALGVDRVHLESRTETLNARDRATVVRLRGVNAISSLLRVDVLKPSAEPMLWIPDIVAGAVKAARSGNGQYLSTIESCVEQIEIALR